MVSLRSLTLALVALGAVHASTNLNAAEQINCSSDELNSAINAVSNLVYKVDFNGSLDAIVSALASIQTQINGALSSITQTVGAVDPSMSMAIGNSLMGPFVTQMTKGAQMLVSKQGGVDAKAAPAVKRLASSFDHLSAEAAKYNVDAHQLRHLAQQLATRAH